MERTDLDAFEYMALRSLCKRRLTKWERGNLTPERMAKLERKGLVFRDGERWKLTASGLLFRSVMRG